MAIRMPDTMKVEREEIDATEWSKYKTVIEEAVQKHVDFRERRSLEKNFNCAYWQYSV
jgi:hypothetical protein